MTGPNPKFLPLIANELQNSKIFGRFANNFKNFSASGRNRRWIKGYGSNRDPLSPPDPRGGRAGLGHDMWNEAMQ